MMVVVVVVVMLMLLLLVVVMVFLYVSQWHFFCSSYSSCCALSLYCIVNAFAGFSRSCDTDVLFHTVPFTWFPYVCECDVRSKMGTAKQWYICSALLQSSTKGQCVMYVLCILFALLGAIRLMFTCEFECICVCVCVYARMRM